MTMHETQVARFGDGGYVVHKITGPFKGKVSAWFDANGNILDAEQVGINPFGQSPSCRPVKRGGPIWRHAASVGLYHKQANPIDFASIKPGSRLLYNDGRAGHKDIGADVIGCSPDGVVVQFEDRADTTYIGRNDGQWWGNIRIV